MIQNDKYPHPKVSGNSEGNSYGLGSGFGSEDYEGDGMGEDLFCCFGAGFGSGAGEYPDGGAACLFESYRHSKFKGGVLIYEFHNVYEGWG